MSTLSSTSLKTSSMSHHRLSPLTIRFLCRLSVCMACTFGFGTFLALYAMPSILGACANGDPKGFLGLVLFVLWIETLVDMSHHVRRDLLQLRANRPTRKPLSIGVHEIHTEGSGQI